MPKFLYLDEILKSEKRQLWINNFLKKRQQGKK